MKLAYHCWTSMHSDLATDIKAAAGAGYDALELGYSKIDDFLVRGSLQDLKQLLEQHQIQPTTLNALEFIAFRGDDYEKIKERARQFCGWCRALGCPTLIVVPSPTPDRELAWDKVVDEYVAVLRDLDDIAAPMEVRLAFEFLGFGWCTVRTPRAAYEIIQKTGRENIGLVIDCMHFYAGGGLLSELDAIAPQRIYTFHLDDVENLPKEAITDVRRLLPGLGVIPLDEICGRLAARGYDGPCSIELFRPEYYEWPPDVLAAKARECALKVLSPHFTIAGDENTSS